jgi:catechol 2,3-dioxygenase-like lactoylglutathione lyase family enzyme
VEDEMGVTLNHTIVHSRDPEEAARFLVEILGLPAPSRFGPFQVVELANGVSLDFLDAGGEAIATQHYAFLVGEGDFDASFGRICERGLRYWADVDDHGVRGGARLTALCMAAIDV